jgi:hypothetical protein
VKAIRTVAEDDDFLTIEGLGIPFGGPFPGGFDSYGTRATPQTDFVWDLFPDRRPDDPPEVPARFTRPLTYQHGFDREVGIRRVGGWSPMRTDKKGVWIQAQINKHDQYFDALRQLIDADKLGLSPASAEHWVDIPEKGAQRGEWRVWPMIEEALTPTPSNPWAQIAARAADAAQVMVHIAGVRATDKSGKPIGPPEGGKEREDIPAEDFAGKNKSFPIVTPESVAKAAKAIGRAGPDNYTTDELKANIIAIAKRKGPAFVAALPDAWREPARSAFRTASDDIGWATHIQGDLAYLMGCEAGEPEQLAKLQAAFDAVTEFIDMESKEIGADEDQPVESAEPPVWPPAWMSAMRQGKRNRASDQALIDGIHDATVALGTTSHLNDGPADDDSTEADAERRAKVLPIRVSGMERTDAKKAIRKVLRKAVRQASRTGSQVADAEIRRLTGRP